MNCFHALPLPDQILIAVLVKTGDNDLAIKAAGYKPECGADEFIRNKIWQADFQAACKSVSDNPALIHEPAAALDMTTVKKMAVRAFEAELAGAGNGRFEVLRLMFEILESEKPTDQTVK